MRSSSILAAISLCACGQSRSAPVEPAAHFQRIELPTGESPGGVEVADLNGDSRPDLVVTNQSGSVSIFVSGGFADVSPAGLTILADTARDAADFSRTEIEQLIAEKQAAVDAAATPEEKAALTNELDQWKNLLLDAAVTTGATAH